MIEIKKVVYPSPEQMDVAVMGVRNSFNSWDKSDSYIDIDGNYIVGEADLKLLRSLFKSPERRKFLRMMPIYLEINAPLYWWKEFDTYKIATVANSCSTMHTLTSRPLDISDFSTDQMSCETAKMCIQNTIDVINKFRNAWMNAVKYEDKKSYWYQMIQLLPSSYNQKRTVMLNYEVILKIWQQRRGHRLEEWTDFCDWITENIISHYDDAK